MPDYSACMTFGCVRRNGCARYRMKFGERQSVGSFPADNCGSFIELTTAPWFCVSMEMADARAQKFQEEVDEEFKRLPLIERAKRYAQ